MENFSIVKFLQNVLVPKSENAQDQEENANAVEGKHIEEKPSDAVVSTNETDGQRAVLRFMEEHERRAKKIRKQ